jgi:Flp pilus assembly protein TadD
VCLLCIGTLIGAACATTSRGVRPAATNEEQTHQEEIPDDSLETAIGEIRYLSAHARPAQKGHSGPTIEGSDPALAAALLTLALSPTAASHRLVADQYARLRILDAANDHYRRAILLDPRDAVAFDGRARIWRDSGLAHLALGDASRAVYFAPGSPEARNTLGTVLQALGHRAEARAAYERALALEPGAAYVLNNLCYLLLVDGQPSQAVHYCQQAIRADPSLTAARHNLALSYAASGRADLAQRELAGADAPPVARYNLGIIGLAQHDYSSALAAFETACAAAPSSPTACARVRQLRGLAAHTPERSR